MVTTGLKRIAIPNGNKRKELRFGGIGNLRNEDKVKSCVNWKYNGEALNALGGNTNSDPQSKCQ